jgi:hypothetical protein
MISRVNAAWSSAASMVVKKLSLGQCAPDCCAQSCSIVRPCFRDLARMASSCLSYRGAGIEEGRACVAQEPQRLDGVGRDVLAWPTCRRGLPAALDANLTSGNPDFTWLSSRMTSAATIGCAAGRFEPCAQLKREGLHAGEYIFGSFGRN